MTEIAAETSSWNDRRLYARSHVVLNGRLRGGVEEQDCVLLDLSATGAMVRLSDPGPSRAHVAVSSEHFGELRGRVVWQMHNVVGPALLRPAAAGRPHDPSGGTASEPGVLNSGPHAQPSEIARRPGRAGLTPRAGAGERASASPRP